LHVAICAEYDALPGIGHACGHNIIAASAVGAGLALATVADDLGITVRVLGTPAEEGGGGKILMLERGAFDGAHLALMIHPGPWERIDLHPVAMADIAIKYLGKEAHASGWPHLGLTASDALVVAQVALSLLRQQFNPGDQVHGIVTRGGIAPNVIPGEAEAHFYARAPKLDNLNVLIARVRNCFEAGALATGTALQFSELSPRYSEMVQDAEVNALYKRNAESIGRQFPNLPHLIGGSTDMANVSMRMPVIHPILNIESGTASNHQPEFAAACITPAADRAAHDGALAMALTVADVATDAQLRARILRPQTIYSTQPPTTSV
jgi:amidohydrolase